MITCAIVIVNPLAAHASDVGTERYVGSASMNYGSRKGNTSCQSSFSSCYHTPTRCVMLTGSLDMPDSQNSCTFSGLDYTVLFKYNEVSGIDLRAHVKLTPHHHNGTSVSYTWGVQPTQYSSSSTIITSIAVIYQGVPANASVDIQEGLMRRPFEQWSGRRELKSSAEDIPRPHSRAPDRGKGFRRGRFKFVPYRASKYTISAGTMFAHVVRNLFDRGHVDVVPGGGVI